MRFGYKFSNLYGTVYSQGNLVFTPDGNSILSPVGNRVSCFNLVTNTSFTFPFECSKVRPATRTPATRTRTPRPVSCRLRWTQSPAGSAIDLKLANPSAPPRCPRAPVPPRPAPRAAGHVRCR